MTKQITIDFATKKGRNYFQQIKDEDGELDFEKILKLIKESSVSECLIKNKKTHFYYKKLPLYTIEIDDVSYGCGFVFECKGRFYKMFLGNNFPSENK